MAQRRSHSNNKTLRHWCKRRYILVNWMTSLEFIIFIQSDIVNRLPYQFLDLWVDFCCHRFQASVIVLSDFIKDLKGLLLYDCIAIWVFYLKVEEPFVSSAEIFSVLLSWLLFKILYLEVKSNNKSIINLRGKKRSDRLLFWKSIGSFSCSNG